jgi:ribulose-phosphate 3-epimerase
MILKPIIPSPYNFDLSLLADSLRVICEEGNVSAIHFDVFDIDFSSKDYDGLKDLITLKDLMQSYRMAADIHLVVADPITYLKKIIDMNLSIPIRVAAHIETNVNLDELAAIARKHGISPGLAINLKTSVPLNFESYKNFDFCHLVCNDEETGLIALQEEVFDKVRDLRQIISDQLSITLDCGVKEHHLSVGKSAGANNYIMGSAIFKTESPAETVKKFNSILE